MLRDNVAGHRWPLCSNGSDFCYLFTEGQFSFYMLSMTVQVSFYTDSKLESPFLMTHHQVLE